MIRPSAFTTHHSSPCLVVALAVLLLAGSACVADDHPVLVYPCERAAQPPTIDGVLDEPAWQQAPLVSGFTYYDKPELLPVQTSFRVLYDDRAVYFGVVCGEPAMDRLKVTRPPRDSLEIFDGECVEVFIDPKHDHQRYLHFVVGAGGSLYDAEGFNRFWSSGAKAAACLGDRQWSVELAIPWGDLGVEPQPARVLGFNVCRDRYLGLNREWTTWSQVEANFHDPARFGHLVVATAPEDIGPLAEEFRKGGRTGPLRVFTREGVAGATYRALAEGSLAEVDALAAQIAAHADTDVAPDVAAEIRKGLEPLRARAAQLRARLGSGSLDAAAWAGLEQQVVALRTDLRALLWQSRLAALLASI
jgi:hypothetical protein